MSRQEKRDKVGWWLPTLIGLILLAAGVRYLSSTDWWTNTFQQNQQTYRTVNTGASVQVSSTAVVESGIPSTDNSIRSPISEPESTGSSPQRRRMW